MASHNLNPNPQHGNPTNVAVVVVPLPAQGHLNPLLHLSRLINGYSIPVHYVGTATHNRQARVRVHGWDLQASSLIHFHDIELSRFENLEPAHNDTTRFPTHLISNALTAASEFREPVFKLMTALSAEFKRVVVIHDSFMGSVIQDVRRISNAESYTFQPVSAFSLFLNTWEATGMRFALDDDVPKPIPSNEGCFTEEVAEFIYMQSKFLSLSAGSLHNTTRSIDGRYIDLLQKVQPKTNMKRFAIGPVSPTIVASSKNTKQRHRCLEWLDNQPQNSVLYVSFGSITTLTADEVMGLALGLEQSKQKFLWALKEADRSDIFAQNANQTGHLPKGFEEAVKDRGIVLRDWAPQLEILGHPSVGGFLSHCGWNSCMESISMGVPIAAWPMHSEQPKNSVLVTEVLRVGIVVRDWESRDKLLTSSAIENSVRRLMATKEGDEIRERAARLGENVRDSAAAGGDSRLEMDSFVAHIRR